MDLYTLVVFLHVTGAAGLFLGLGIEGSVFKFFKSAATTQQVFGVVGSLKFLRITFAISTVLLLLSGIYMATELWGWTAWVITGLILLVALSGSGSMTGKKIAGIIKSLNTTNEPLPADFQNKLGLSFLIKAFKIKILLVIGTIFIMTMKADWMFSIISIVAAFLIGLVISSIGENKTA